MLLAGGDDNQSKSDAYQTSKGVVSDYIQGYVVEYPENSCKQLKSELNVRFAVVNDPIMFLPCYIRQGMSNMRFTQRGCMLWQMTHLQK